MVALPKNREQNRGTQPLVRFRVFDNWDVVAKGWYVACRSSELPARGVRAAEIAGQRVVVYRGEDGRARALDAYCPHMGTDLAIGAVVDQTLRCFFHHWRFDGTGACVDVPCLAGQGTPPPARARLAAYTTCERYGFVWVWPDREAPGPVAEFPGLEGQDVLVWHDEPFTRPCHHHVTMINGIDPQHLATVHRLHVELSLELTEHDAGRVVDYTLRGDIPTRSLAGRLTRALVGPRYAYAMRYADACLGLLTTALELRLFGRGPRLPAVRTGYAYTPQLDGTTRVQPFYVAPRGRGPGGWLLAQLLLLAAWIGYRVLKSEDGKIYDNMRFQPGALLPLDRPVARFIAYVNRLEASAWSRVPPAAAPLEGGSEDGGLLDERPPGS